MDQKLIREAEQAIVTLDENRSQNNIWKLIRILKECVQNSLGLYVPLLGQEAGEDLMEIPKMDLFTAALPSNRQYRKVELEKGGLAYCAFTSKEEMDKGQETGYQQIAAGDMFALALDDENSMGLILNPWGLSILLNKELLGLILDENEEEEPANFQSALYIDHSESCDQNTDVVVNAAFAPFTFNEPCSAAMLKEAGEPLKALCETIPAPREGEIVVTNAPGLSAKKVFHAALPQNPDEKSYSALICSILSLAEKMGMQSVTLPAIGSEEGLVDPELPFAVIAAAGWFNAHPHSTMSVTITCRSQETYQDFLSYLFD